MFGRFMPTEGNKKRSQRKLATLFYRLGRCFNGENS